MRVTSQMAIGTLVGNLDRSYERIARFQRELSSGTRLSKLSDDPAAVERSLALRGELRNIEQFQHNIDNGVGWLELNEVALSELETLFVEVRGLAVQGASSTYNASQRQAMADQVDQLLEQAFVLSETRHLGRYIFSGTQTATAPYQAVRDANGSILAVEANGDSGGTIEREIADRMVMQVNVAGRDVFEDPQAVVIYLGKLDQHLDPEDAARLQELFGEDKNLTLDELETLLEELPGEPPLSAELEELLQDLHVHYAPRKSNPFGALIELREALRNDNLEGVRGSLDSLTAVRERVSSVRGLIGARINRMETMHLVLDRVSVEMSDILVKDEGVDLTAAIVNLQEAQHIFQAALASGSALMPPSLMDFI